MGVVDTVEWACVLCGLHIQNAWASRAMNLHQICIKLEHSSKETIWMIQKDAAMGNWWLAASSQQCTCSCIMSHKEFFPGDSVTYSPEPCDVWLFPKLKSPLKGKRFQTIDEIQENMMGQLMVIWRSVWGIIVLHTVFLVSCIFFSKFLYFTYYVSGYFLDRPPV